MGRGWNLQTARPLYLLIALAASVGSVGSGCSRPDRAAATGYAGDESQQSNDGEKSSGGEARSGSTDLDDDDYVRGLFLEVEGAPRIRTCAPARATWVILAYAPEVIDDHRVRTREVHCTERTISDRCTLVAEERYYLLDPKDYFTVGPGVKVERALQLAELALKLADGRRLLAVAADKRAQLVTFGTCGSETQLAVRVKGRGREQSLEVIETRYSVEL